MKMSHVLAKMMFSLQFRVPAVYSLRKTQTLKRYKGMQMQHAGGDEK